MGLVSALGWVARTVLIKGSSTGFTPPPRGAPSRASRRRTPDPPLTPGGAGCVRGSADVVDAAAAGRDAARRGCTASRATSLSSPGLAVPACSPGADWVTSALVMPVIATSPATYAPVVRQALSLSGPARRARCLASWGARDRVGPPARNFAHTWGQADGLPRAPGEPPSLAGTRRRRRG